MVGAIAGDIIGSVFEFNNIKHKDFPLFCDESHITDDSVLTIALADAILRDVDYGALMKQYYLHYPNASYGMRFHVWASSQSNKPYNSFGNGAAMRISPVAYAYDTLEEVLQKAEHFTAVTHDHPEGLKGAKATAAAIFLARSGASKREIRRYTEDVFRYDLSGTLEEIRPSYQFDETCQGTVPQAIIAFLESEDFEDAIRNAISLGGDSDTLACITGSIAEAFYRGVPSDIAENALLKLDKSLLSITREFSLRYLHHNSRA